MKKLLIYALPLALVAAQTAVAAPLGWGATATRDLTAATGATDDAPLVLIQHRRGGGASVSRTNVNRTTVNRTNFNSNNFHRDVSVNRNVVVTGGNSGPNWGGVAAGVAVGVGVTAAATAAANSASYPPPPPYPYTPYGY
jgi:hypothetical protein